MDDDDIKNLINNIEVRACQTSNQTSDAMKKIIASLQSGMNKHSIGVTTSPATNTTIGSLEDEINNDEINNDEINISQACSYKHAHVLIEQLLFVAFERGMDSEIRKNLKVLIKISNVLNPERVKKGIDLLTVQQVLEE